MPNKGEINGKSEQLSSKIGSENDGSEYTEYQLTVRCTKSQNGKRSCTIQDISVVEPPKDSPAESPVVSPQKETPVDAVPPKTVATVSKETPAEKDGDCDLCDFIDDELQKKATAEAAATAEKTNATRRIPSWAHRRNPVKS